MMRKEKPDSGWSWLVVVAAAVTRIIVYGVGYTSGVVYTIILDVFHMSKGDTSWISSVVTATMYFSGLLSGYLVDRYGCRKTAFAGGIVATVGMIGSAFSVNLAMLIIFYGVMTGTGIGLTFVPINVAVSKYHNKRRNLALGIASAGGGIGTLAFPPLIKYLEGRYGWRGMFLLLSGVALNICVIALLFRPVSRKDSEDVLIVEVDEEENSTQNVEEHEMSTKLILSKVDSSESVDKSTENMQNHNHISINSNKNDETTGDKCNDALLETKHPSFSSSSDSQSTCLQNNVQFTKFKLLITDIKMIVFCLNNLFVAFGTSIVYGHLDAYAQFVLGFQKYEAAFVYSMVGIFVMIGKFTQGVIANWKTNSPIAILFLCYLINGLASCLLLIKLNYAALLVYAIVYGYTYAALGGSVTPALLIKLTGVDGLAFSYGIIYACVGIGKLFGAPVAGFIIDSSDSYMFPFIVAASTIVLSAVVMLPWFQTFRCKKSKNSSQIE